MTECIDREALIDAVESIDWYSVYKGKLITGAPNTENALYKASSIYAVIDNAPSADVVPVQKWISVKDRLPEMGEHYQSEDVLVCIDYRPDDPDTTQDSYVSIDHVDFNCFGQGEFSCERDDPRDGEPSPYFVTHWMPIPEPPKEE